MKQAIYASPRGVSSAGATMSARYVLEGHPQLAPRFQLLFDRHAGGEIAFAVTTITIAEVLTGPLSAGNEALVKRYRAVLESWQVIELTADIAESAAACGRA